MEKPLKILMVNYEFPPIGGGGGKAHLNLLKEYAKLSNLQVDVLTSAPQPKNITEHFSNNITIHKIGIHKKDLYYWRKAEVLEWLFKAKGYLDRLIYTNDYNFAHAFFGFPTGWLTYRCRKKLPYLISLRGSDVPGDNPRLGLEYKLLGPLFRKIWKHADKLAANSSGLAQRAKIFASELNYEIIPNGVDTNHFTPIQNKPPMTPFKLVAVGRFNQVKRLDLAIQGIHQAQKQGLNAELTLVGNGNLLDELKNLTQRLNIAGHVHFTGWLDPTDMPACYQSHHAFILTSINEGMNNAMLEAMACGLPIITTSCEGTEELVTDNGKILDTPDPKLVAQAICDIANNVQIYEQMSDASRKTAECFSWTVSAQQYIKLYQQLTTL